MFEGALRTSLGVELAAANLLPRSRGPVLQLVHKHTLQRTVLVHGLSHRRTKGSCFR